MTGPRWRRYSHEPVLIDHCLVAHPLVDEVLAHGRFPGAREIVVRAGIGTRERCVRADPVDARIEVAGDVRTGAGAYVHEEVAGVRIRVSARSFFQTRTDGAEVLARVVRDRDRAESVRC